MVARRWTVVGGRSDGVRPLHVAAWRARSPGRGRWSGVGGFRIRAVPAIPSLRSICLLSEAAILTGETAARRQGGDQTGSGRCTLRRGVRCRQTVVGGRLPMGFGLGYRSPSTHYPLLPTRYCGRAVGSGQAVARCGEAHAVGRPWSAVSCRSIWYWGIVDCLLTTRYCLLATAGG